MWLEIKQTANMEILDEMQLAIPVIAEVFARVEEPFPGKPESYRVGRIMADRLDVSRIVELGASVWSVADSDSSGLESAWASLLDEDGTIRAEMSDTDLESVVYMYRFFLHTDFVEWKMPVMDMFCHVFGRAAVVLAQHHTTLFSDTEFSALGFNLLPPTRFAAPVGYPDIDRETQFWARENRLSADYGFSDYPEEPPGALPKHEAWIQEQCPNDRLC
ncbi:MAG TPA: hypothetical protein VG826_26095 [Pirellulales bacterium]|nr:hypothetical protein [Pirellulales bacterium]